MTSAIRPIRIDVLAVVLVGSDERWARWKTAYGAERAGVTVWGEFFIRGVGWHRVIFFHTGAGPVAEAAGIQFALDRWRPALLATAEPVSDAVSAVADRNGIDLITVPSQEPSEDDADVTGAVTSVLLEAAESRLAQKRTL